MAKRAANPMLIKRSVYARLGEWRIRDSSCYEAFVDPKSVKRRNEDRALANRVKRGKPFLT